MKIDFTKKLTNLNGEVLTDATSKKDITLSFICVEALLATEKDVTGDEKMKRYKLAIDIFEGKKEGLSAEEIVLLKELIGKYFTVLIVGQVFPILSSE